MGIGKNQAFLCEPVQIWRGDSAATVEDGDIAITHVIREDDHDIRLERFWLRRNVAVCGNRPQHQPAGEGK